MSVLENLKEFPTLESDRLLLRQFDVTDAPEIKRLASAKEIAQYTSIPHPYGDGVAESWIEMLAREFEAGNTLAFAVTRKSDGQFMGCSSLRMQSRHNIAAMGYWIGVPYWGKGFTTEAAREVMAFGFNALNLHRIYAEHMGTNLGSGKVMQKIGMKLEGRLREHFDRYGEREDSVVYGMLRSEFEALAH